MNHTPGDWIAYISCAQTHNHPERFWEGAVTVQGVGVVGTGHGATQEEAAANARLIAAAPELLEALQNLAYHEARISPPPYGHSCRWCGDCVQRAKDDARAALAKARGLR